MDSMNIHGPKHLQQRQNRAPDLREPAELLDTGTLLPLKDKLIETKAIDDTAARLLEVRKKLADPVNLRAIDSKLADPAELLPVPELDEPVQLRNASGSSKKEPGIGTMARNWLRSLFGQ